jgi:glycosyltransferase involved in cell wall biosynthesis
MQEQAARHILKLRNDSYPQDNRMYDEATALVAAGHRVSVICSKLPGQPMYEELDSVHVYRYPATPFTGQGIVSYAWEYTYAMSALFIISLFLLITRPFDVVHVHSPPDTLVTIALFYKLLGKQFVYDHQDLSPELYYARFGGVGNPLIYRMLVLFEQLSCRLADHIITPNESYKRIDIERGGARAERITPVRVGPHVGTIRESDLQPVEFERTKTVIGYVGVIGFQDGLDHLLRALAHVVYDLKRPDILCIIMGDGDAMPTLRALAAELNIEPYIWFTGWMSDADLRRYYLSISDICVVPDPSNPFNDRSTMVKMVEYMILGKPVVAFDTPENRVSAQDAAAYARGNDELDMARRLVELIDDPQRRTQMSQIGRHRVDTEIGWPHQARKLVQAYATLDRARGARTPYDVNMVHGR